MAPPAPIRILIVDDSAVMRSLLRSVVNSDKCLEVAGTANDGASALLAMDSLHPDLVLLDVEMPVMDGLATLKQMRLRGKRFPVIMCSTLTQRGARVTIEALACGASDYVAKPSGQDSREAAIKVLANDLISKILALTGSHAVVSAQLPAFFSPSSKSQPGRPAQAHVQGPRLVSAPPTTTASVTPSVVLIGVSTGGPAALEALLPALPANFPVPVLVVQHMPELFTKILAQRLNSRCLLQVSEAVSGEHVRPGHVYIARGNWHMELQAPPDSAPRIPLIRLTQEPHENHCRPSVDALFRSGVAVYGAATLGVILTGMGSDGLAGCRLIREHFGSILAQDQATSAVWGMPGAVAQAGLAHRVLPLGAIVPEILRLTSRGQREATELRESVV